MWLWMLAVAVSYYVSGQLGRVLAIPSGYATAFWPASGFALAGLLLFGYRVWPGILAASLLINTPASLDFSNSQAVLAGWGCLWEWHWGPF